MRAPSNRIYRAVAVVLAAAVCLSTATVLAWTPLPVADDPLVRMPGTQPDQGVTVEGPNRCLNCHAGYNTAVEPGHNWKGSMMAQAGRDFLFWSCMTVAAQDSVWALGNPNATDLCLRCHFPSGWMQGRSDPTNASAMVGDDFDGLHCDVCHAMVDPHFEATYRGERESSDWLAYWDETNLSSTPSQLAADEAYTQDASVLALVQLFSGLPFLEGKRPAQSGYTEAAAGQFFVDGAGAKRASFADAAARHQMLYSRFHKSRYFCATCHDVSNPALANLDFAGTAPGDGSTVLPTEADAASSYFHVERTFSEFMLSDYAVGAGSQGRGAFAPDVFETSNPDNRIARCQDCHMRDVVGVGCDKRGVPVRPLESFEHPKSGQPLHDLTGGNAWVSRVLATAVVGSPIYDATNDALLNQGPAALTLDLTQGLGVDPAALRDGSDRALQQLTFAATIEDLAYDGATGALSFRVQNNTGHKLISGFPEGRRMFVNVQAWQGDALVYEINPYDAEAGTLKGLSGYTYADPVAPALPGPAPLGANEHYEDGLVYETHPSSTLTGEDETFHFVLADGRYKDNRIPPKGFRIAEAAARLSEPVWHGDAAPELYSADEYAGGYDAVNLNLPAGAERVTVRLYYQTTSREYIEFLRDEIRGSASSLSSPTPSGEPSAYIVQTDPFFGQLRPWGDTMWALWKHNKDLPGAAPVLMTEAWVGGTPPAACTPPVPTLLAATPGHGEVTLTWSDEHSGDADVTGYRLWYEQAGKLQLAAELGLVTSYVDTGLTNGQTYCYVVTSLYADCESEDSETLCATPANLSTIEAGVALVETGRWETQGKGRSATTTFVLTDTYAVGDEVTLRAYVMETASGLALENATVTLAIQGPESLQVATTASDAAGLAEAYWKTSAPNKKGQGGTSPGAYDVFVVDVTGNGIVWDGAPVTASFVLQ